MDIEKTMEFILSVQARLEASVQNHDEILAKHDAMLAKHDEQMAQIETSMVSLTDLVGRLAQAEIRLVERVDAVAASVQELRDSQAASDYKLNALIETVDKLVRRNGPEPSSPTA